MQWVHGDIQMSLNEGVKREAPSQRALQGAQLFKACPHLAHSRPPPPAPQNGEGYTRRSSHRAGCTPPQGVQLVNQQPQPSSALTLEPKEPEPGL